MTTEPEDQFLPEGPTPTWLVSLDAPEPDPEELSFCSSSPALYPLRVSVGKNASELTTLL